MQGKIGLQGGLVEAGKGTSSICGLELGRSYPPERAIKYG